MERGVEVTMMSRELVSLRRSSPEHGRTHPSLKGWAHGFRPKSARHRPRGSAPSPGEWPRQHPDQSPHRPHDLARLACGWRAEHVISAWPIAGAGNLDAIVLRCMMRLGRDIPDVRLADMVRPPS